MAQTQSTAPILRDLPERLQGDRVLLRPFAPGDGNAVFAAVAESRERLDYWFPWARAHATEADSEAYVRRSHARWALREDLTLGIWDSSGNECLGGTGLHRINWEVPSFEIGYWIRTSAEGKGLVTESVRILTRFAFDVLSAQRVFIKCDAANTRSAAVARRAGYLQEAHLRNDSLNEQGGICDTLIFGMTSDDYRKDPACER